MATYNNKKITTTFSSSDSQNAWAYIDAVGWRKIKTGSTDGVTNVYIMLNAAKANNRLVNVSTDSNNYITTVYLK